MIELTPKLMRAARALAGMEQSDLAEASGLSIATIRKIEQGAAGMREDTQAKLIAAFVDAGIQLIPEGRGGGAGMRYMEREMTEEMRKYHHSNRLRENAMTSATELSSFSRCRWCGQIAHAGICPTIKVIEYYPDGITVKRIEFRDYSDSARAVAILDKDK